MKKSPAIRRRIVVVNKRLVILLRQMSNHLINPLSKNEYRALTGDPCRYDKRAIGYTHGQEAYMAAIESAELYRELHRLHRELKNALKAEAYAIFDKNLRDYNASMRLGLNLFKG